MGQTLAQIQETVAALKLDDALLYLCHALATARGETDDRQLSACIAEERTIPPHVVHFLARELVLHASNLGIRTLDWPTLNELRRLVIALEDPIQNDPNWKHADPTGFFVRLMHQQLPSQDSRLAQRVGLALGLFRDVGVVHSQQPFDLRAEIEAELGMPIDAFVAIGFVASALRLAKCGAYRCRGTFTPEFLADAYAQGVTTTDSERSGLGHALWHSGFLKMKPLALLFGVSPMSRLRRRLTISMMATSTIMTQFTKCESDARRSEA